MNGSRGVIVDWVDRDLVPLDDKLDSTQSGLAQKRKIGGGAFGGEEWRQKAADEWADKQATEVFPLVYFATGAQGELVTGRKPCTMGLTGLTKQSSSVRTRGASTLIRRTRWPGLSCLCSSLGMLA